jgi:hypothetical protein
MLFLRFSRFVFLMVLIRIGVCTKGFFGFFPHMSALKPASSPNGQKFHNRNTHLIHSTIKINKTRKTTPQKQSHNLEQTFQKKGMGLFGLV